ncbi:MAG: hypothetical protein JWN70_5521 [Planctomycetaceae bacterium]|nr:hypothetical protein [Planctomycetaceae bacterium]
MPAEFSSADALRSPSTSCNLFQTGRCRELSSLLSGELAAAERSGDRQAFIASANDLACAHRAVGDHETAAYFQLLAATSERQPVDGRAGRISATSLGNLACDALLAGRWALAESLLWKSLLAELGAGNAPGAAADWANLGLIAGLLGELQEAKVRLWCALKLHRQQGDLFHVALDLWHLGQLFEIDGDWLRSKKLFQRAASRFAEIGHPQLRQEAVSRARLNEARAAVLAFDVRLN